MAETTENRSAPSGATMTAGPAPFSTPVITADAVMESLRSAAARNDQETCRAIFKGSVSDKDILRLLAGVLLMRGDSRTGIEIVHRDAPEGPRS